MCENLSYAEQRYDSRSKPMSVFLSKIGPALEVLKDVSVLQAYHIRSAIMGSASECLPLGVGLGLQHQGANILCSIF